MEKQVATLHCIPILQRAHRPVQAALLLYHGGVTGALLRKSAPADWQIADKSGAGDNSRNLVALITPPGRAPWIAAIYLGDAETDFATRNKALAEIGAAVVEVVRAP